MCHDPAAVKEEVRGGRWAALGQWALRQLLDCCNYKDCDGWNKTAYVIILAGFGLAYGACWALTGKVGANTLLTAGGPTVALLDLAYRLRSPSGHWFRPDGGGRFFFLPLWVWGLIWLTMVLAGVNSE